MVNTSAIVQVLEAAGCGRLAEVKKHVKKNPGVLHQKGKMDISVGHMAAFYGRCDILQFLKDKDSKTLYCRTADGETLAHSAAANGCCDVLRFLSRVDIGLVLGSDTDGWTAAHTAAFYQQFDALAMLTKVSPLLKIARNKDGLQPEEIPSWRPSKEQQRSWKRNQRPASSVEKGEDTSRLNVRTSDGQIDIASAEQEGKWKALLKGLRKGTDITNMLIPVDFIRPESSLERVQDIMQHGRLLEDVVRPRQSPLERMLAVTRFQISSVIKAIFDGKKPYNPVLGETCAWAWQHPDRNGVSRMVCEQVSHHPPISAVHLSNETLGVSMQGYAEIVPKFTGNSVVVPFKGERSLHLHSLGERYVMSYLPNLQYRGLLLGSRGAEWTGKVAIRCEETQLECKLNFKALGMLGMWGSWHQVEGAVQRTDASKRLEGTISGRWDELVHFTPAGGHPRGGLAVQAVPLYNFELAAQQAAVPLLPTPDAILSSDSQVVWRRLTAALKEGDLKTAAKEKSAVEQAQRNLAAIRSQRNQSFAPAFFQQAADDGSKDKKKSKSLAGSRWVPRVEEIEKFHAQRMQVA